MNAVDAEIMGELRATMAPRLARRQHLAELETARAELLERRPALLETARQARAEAVAAQEELVRRKNEVRIIQGRAGNAANAVMFADDKVRELDRQIGELRAALDADARAAEAPIVHSRPHTPRKVTA